jgi:polyferredoxin
VGISCPVGAVYAVILKDDISVVRVDGWVCRQQDV